MAAGDLFPLAHLVERFKVALRGFISALRLYHCDFGVIHQLLGERALFLKGDAIFIQTPGGFERLRGRVDIVFGFGAIFENGSPGSGLVRRLGLLELSPAFANSRREVAVFKLRDRLARANVIPAIDHHALNRRGDLRHHVRLVDRIQHRIHADDVIDGTATRGLRLHRGGRFGFAAFVGFLFFAAGEKSKRRQRKNRGSFKCAAMQHYNLPVKV